MSFLLLKVFFCSGEPIRHEGPDREDVEGHAVLAHPRRRDQQPPQGQLCLDPVREPETRPLPARLPECRISDGESWRRRLLDDDSKSDQRQCPAPHGRL